MIRMGDSVRWYDQRTGCSSCCEYVVVLWKLKLWVKCVRNIHMTGQWCQMVRVYSILFKVFYEEKHYLFMFNKIVNCLLMVWSMVVSSDSGFSSFYTIFLRLCFIVLLSLCEDFIRFCQESILTKLLTRSFNVSHSAYKPLNRQKATIKHFSSSLCFSINFIVNFAFTCRNMRADKIDRFNHKFDISQPNIWKYRVMRS